MGFGDFCGRGTRWAIRESRYKLIHSAGEQPPRLYDLEQDPNEIHNRHGDPELAPVRRRLRDELLARAMDCARRFPAQILPTRADDPFGLPMAD